MAIGKAPFIGCSFPSRESSPMMMYFDKLSVFNCSDAAKIPIAIGKSYAEPSLRISAGERLMIMRILGM